MNQGRWREEDDRSDDDNDYRQDRWRPGDRSMAGYGRAMGGGRGRDEWRGDDRGRDQGGYGASPYRERETYGSYGGFSSGEYGGRGGGIGEFPLGGRGGYEFYGSGNYPPARGGYGPTSHENEEWRGRAGGVRGRYGREEAHDRDDDRGLLERAGDWLQRKLGKAPKGYTRSDDRIREDLSEAIWRRGDLDASEVEIVVKDGEVTLTGVVLERRVKRQIEDLAEDILGVNDVHNQIKVQREHGQTQSQSTAGRSMTGSASTSSHPPGSPKTPRA